MIPPCSSSFTNGLMVWMPTGQTSPSALRSPSSPACRIRTRTSPESPPRCQRSPPPTSGAIAVVAEVSSETDPPIARGERSFLPPPPKASYSLSTRWSAGITYGDPPMTPTRTLDPGCCSCPGTLTVGEPPAP